MPDLRTALWDDNPVDITAEANFIWSIANKLRGSYMPDKYGNVIIPMTIIRRFECALADTKDKVVAQYKQNPAYPAKAMQRVSGYQFYNTSEFNLKELCNDPDHIAENFREYFNGFSANVQDIFRELNMDDHIKKMDKDGCLYSVVKAFSELDLSIKTFDSIKMGYIFENLIGRFYQNVDAGQFYTGRDIIKLLVALLLAEGCDDIFDPGKVITIEDQACGTGGMLTTGCSYIKHFNPSADVRLFGQEFMGQSYAIGLAEMLIRGQNADNFRHADTLKEDCFPDVKMRFLIENPPFGTPWAGADAKDGQEEAVKREFAKGFHGRWGAGLPGGGSGFDLTGKIKASQFVQKKGDTHSGEKLVSKPVMKLPESDGFNLSEAKKERLSQIIRDINSRMGMQFDDDVAVKAMLQIKDLLMKSDKLKTSAQNNSEKDFEFSFYDDIDDALIEGLEQNQDFFTLLLNNEEIKRSVLGIFTSEIYTSLRKLTD